MTLDQKQFQVILNYIAGLIRRECLCHVRTHGTKCTRCSALYEARDAFPAIFTGAAEQVALAGSKKEF